ncbi:MAG: dipeptide epimerase [Xanthomonadales bacterium]|nr:dipeptide epimerase [Xanthomonadales bacterium]NIX14023.1 dipeptide epimerase [Xanthomonadales bacterium]
MKLTTRIDNWELNDPFVTAVESITHIRTLTVTLEEGGYIGRGEALGVDYLGEDADSMAAQIAAVSKEIQPGTSREALQSLLPRGGARNALDCALWDLESRRRHCRAWELAGQSVRPVTTVYTLSLDSAGNMAREAALHRHFPVLKLKLDGRDTAEKLRAVRAARADAELVIDGNGSWSPDLLDELAGPLLECRVAMLEQPLPAGEDAVLEGLDYPVTLCADESCQDSSDLERMASRYGMVNIKLDKCGGLTEGLRMVERCRERGLAMMVGNMLGSSLAMAPAFLVAQHCRFTDLDGPLWQKTDRRQPIRYQNAEMQPPSRELWG